MSLSALWFIALGLSMDAFAVSICQGLSATNFRWRHALKTAVFFGSFQALMPLIGFLLGLQFSEMIKEFDHWVSFALLTLLGLKMFKEALSKEDNDCSARNFSTKSLLTLGFVTSIDALAAGISFAFLSVNIWQAIIIIGGVAAFLSVIGVKSGYLLGGKLKSKAEILGGIILIFIAIRILFEHHVF